MPFWSDRVDSLELSARPRRGALSAVGQLFDEVRNGFRLWRRSRDYDAVITEDRLFVSVFGLLQRLPFTTKRRHLLLDCYWVRPEGRIRRLAKTLQFHAAVSPHTRAIVYARRERDTFSECFGIPKEKFVFIPYHTTTFGYHGAEVQFPARPYLFASGESQRDYRTLLAAVDGLDLHVIVAVRNPALFDRLAVPANVEIVTTSHEGVLQYMEGAAINAVPLAAGTLRSAGHQTFLNAMAFGTVVVVSDPDGGRDYIDHGESGILVPPGDAQTLRTALRQLQADASLRERLSAGARRAAAERYNTERILLLYLDFLFSPSFVDPTCTEYLDPRTSVGRPQFVTS